jgi:hypothetical protein
VVLRLAPVGLVLIGVAVAAAGADRVAFLLLLAAVPLAAAAGLVVVAEAVDHGRSRTSALPAAFSVGLIVLAAATRRPELALGCLACLTTESATRKRIALSAAREIP